jgi:hypothetical protein
MILIFLSACKEEKKIEVVKNVKIDTTYSGKIGKPGYSISISHRIDSILVEWHYRYWEDSKRIEVKDQYMDDKGKLRYIYYKYYPDKNKIRISHSWEDKWGQSVLSIDSEFVYGKLKTFEITISKEKQMGYDGLEYIIEKKFSNGKLNAFRIHDFYRNYKYSEENGKFWKLPTDVPIEYSEWESSSKYAFGKSYSDAVESLALAYLRIDSTFIEVAKIKHNFDLTSFVRNGNF